MSININQSKCIGCSSCVNVCPGNLICMTSEKAIISYEKDCWGCASCLKACPVNAISLYIGEDIGGKGGFINAVLEDKKITWSIYNKDKQEVLKVQTNREESNTY